MKSQVKEMAKNTTDENFEQMRDQLQASSLLSEAAAAVKNGPMAAAPVAEQKPAVAPAENGDEAAAKKTLEDAKNAKPADVKEEKQAGDTAQNINVDDKGKMTEVKEEKK